MTAASATNDNSLDPLTPLARALVTRFRHHMPTVNDLTAAPYEAGALDLGPEVTLPAIWLHLLICELEMAALRPRLAEKALHSKMLTAMATNGPERGA